ncbi:MAG: methyltransferase domain-containing protein [Syntrophobacteraceae bacterium]
MEILLPAMTAAKETESEAECDRNGQWPDIAAQWRRIGPPLRPTAQDINFCLDAVLEWVRNRGAPPRVLLLGVTPELYHLPWPHGTDFLSVDRTPEMIDHVWPGPKDRVLCSDWSWMRLPDHSRDIVLCDGGLHLLAYPEEQQRVAHLLKRIVSDHGICIFRLYVPPPYRESLDSVVRDMMDGNISSLNILKLRLGMSLLNSTAEGVELDAVWRAIHAAVPELRKLASRLDWSLDHIMAINTYRGSRARYFFSTIEQICALFCAGQGGFEIHNVLVPTYELGERCPTLILKRLSGRTARVNR